jgi:hypothetical protein
LFEWKEAIGFGEGEHGFGGGCVKRGVVDSSEGIWSEVIHLFFYYIWES